MRKPCRIFNNMPFWSGFFSAFLLFIVLVAGVLFFMTSRGLTIYLDSEEVARIVQEQVVVQARQNLPELIKGAKADIPGIVEKEMSGQLTSDRMEIAGFVFRVPDDLMGQLKKKIQDNVENATGEILDGIDTEEVAEQFGQDVYLMVRQTMHDELHGQSFKIMAFNRIPVQVRISVHCQVSSSRTSSVKALPNKNNYGILQNGVKIHASQISPGVPDFRSCGNMKTGGRKTERRCRNVRCIYETVA